MTFENTLCNHIFKFKIFLKLNETRTEIQTAIEHLKSIK